MSSTRQKEKRCPGRSDSTTVTECVILIGLPAAGKTTFYNRQFAATHVHISKDLGPSASGKDARQERLLRESLQAGRSVVIDNTNPAIEDRAPLIRIAREHGARVIGFHLQATTREAVGRNRGREGKQRVPDVAIFTKAKRMVAPSAREGFDELYRVSIRDDGSFDVQPVTDSKG
jgi:predicted kinase